VLEAPALPPPPPLELLLDRALDAPIASPPLEALVSAGARVTVVVSDASRDEPRAAFLDAIRARLPTVRWTIAVATGTHGPARLDRLGIPERWRRDATIVNHDGHLPDDLVDLGCTVHGTAVRVHRAVVDADLVIATGCLRPHYFAGFGAGIKAVFPGLGEAASIRHNHALKQHPRARAGIVEGNPVRADLDEAVRRIPTPLFLLDGVCGPDGGIHHVVAGDPWRAFAVGVELARPWFTVHARPAPLVVVSDVPPVTSSLYQAAKLAAAAAPLVEAGGCLVLVAECADGIGPLDVVNDAIFRIGVQPRLALGVTLALVSALPASEVELTCLRPIGRLEELGRSDRGVLVLPRASQLICEPLPE
jgi:nickel-dependent lactate racemase